MARTPAEHPHKVKTNRENMTLTVDDAHVLGLGNFDQATNNQLALTALRGFLRKAIFNVVPENVAKSIAALVESIKSGDAFKRSSSGGHGLERFVKTLAAANGISVEAAEQAISNKQAQLGATTVKNKQGTEVNAFEHWIATVQRTEEYKSKFRELYPRKKSEPRAKKSLADLLS